MAKPQIFKEVDYMGLFNLNQMEKQYIKIAMKRVEGHRERAAKLLCISERTLYRKLYQHNL